MRSQAVVLSAFVAALIIFIITSALFVLILPKSNIRVLEQRRIDIWKIIETRLNWSARELAETIAVTYGLEYIEVNITVYNILNNNTLIRDEYVSYEPLAVNKAQYTYYIYTYSVLTRDGKYIIYDIEVGIR